MMVNQTLRKKALLTLEDEFDPPHKFSEVKRQLFHLVYGLVIIAAVLVFGKLPVASFLTMVLLLGGVLILAHRKKKISLLEIVLQHVDRPSDLEIFPGKGAFFFTFGSLFALFIFPQNIALAGLCILTFGDSASHLTGLFVRKHYRREPEIKKLIEGTIAGIIISSVAAAFFVDPLFGFLASALVMFIEFIENLLAGIDDNFYIPLLSSCILIALHFLFA